MKNTFPKSADLNLFGVFHSQTCVRGFIFIIRSEIIRVGQVKQTLGAYENMAFIWFLGRGA